MAHPHQHDVRLGDLRHERHRPVPLWIPIMLFAAWVAVIAGWIASMDVLPLR